jgi:hypothetical protein
MDHIAEQLQLFIEEHTLTDVDELVFSSALFILSSDQGKEVSHKVGKWFYQDKKGVEKYFKNTTYVEGDDQAIVEYYVLVLLEGDESISTLSLGIIEFNNSFYDIFTFMSQFKLESESDNAANVNVFVKSPPGYVLEIACINNPKNVTLSDLSDAFHIQSKYTQRLRNITHYYPTQSVSDAAPTDTFRVLEKEDSDIHAWNLHKSVTLNDIAVAHKHDYMVEIGQGTNIFMVEKHSLASTNTKGVLLYDICSQSLTSASIPKTHLIVPWILKKDGIALLMLKVVV